MEHAPELLLSSLPKSQKPLHKRSQASGSPHPRPLLPVPDPMCLLSLLLPTPCLCPRHTHTMAIPAQQSLCFPPLGRKCSRTTGPHRKDLNCPWAQLSKCASPVATWSLSLKGPDSPRDIRMCWRLAFFSSYFWTDSSVFMVLFSVLISSALAKPFSCLLYCQGTRLSSKISGVSCQVTCLSLWSQALLACVSSDGGEEAPARGGERVSGSLQCPPQPCYLPPQQKQS